MTRTETDFLGALARRYCWDAEDCTSVEPARIVQRVMDLGVLEDELALEPILGRDRLINILTCGADWLWSEASAQRWRCSPSMQPSEAYKELVYSGDGNLGSVSAPDRAILISHVDHFAGPVAMTIVSSRLALEDA